MTDQPDAVRFTGDTLLARFAQQMGKLMALVPAGETPDTEALAPAAWDGLAGELNLLLEARGDVVAIAAAAVRETDLAEQLRQVTAERNHLLATTALPDSAQEIADLLRQARIEYSAGGIAGAGRTLKQVFDLIPGPAYVPPIECPLEQDCGTRGIEPCGELVGADGKCPVAGHHQLVMENPYYAKYGYVVNYRLQHPSASPETPAVADWQGDGFPPGHPKHQAAAAATDAAAVPSPAGPAGSSGTGEGVSEHIRNALQILNGVLDDDWQPQNLTPAQLDLAAQGLGARLVAAHEHPDCRAQAKYELEVAAGLVAAIAADVSLPGKTEERKQSLMMLRFRLNAALVDQGEPVPPTAEALAQLGIERVGE